MVFTMLWMGGLHYFRLNKSLGDLLQDILEVSREEYLLKDNGFCNKDILLEGWSCWVIVTSLNGI